MKTYWPFLIAAIAVALSSDKIDAAVRGGRRLRRALRILCAGAAAASLFWMAVGILSL